MDSVTVNFCARITPKQARKIKVYLANKDKNNTDLISHVIDNIDRLRPALDATTGRKK